MFARDYFGGHHDAIAERDRRGLPLRRDPILRVRERLRDNPLPLPDVPARQWRAISNVGGIRFG